jgi:hypothetical protein
VARDSLSSCLKDRTLALRLTTLEMGKKSKQKLERKVPQSPYFFSMVWLYHFLALPFKEKGKGDEDIATLDTLMLWSSPSCNSSPTQPLRHPRIQQTRHHCFSHNFLIRHRNGAFLDVWKGDDNAVILDLVPSLEGPWIILCDHDKVLHHLFGPTWPCIMSGLKPKLWAPNP